MPKPKPKPELTRAGRQWTEARYWSFLRSALRRAFVRWPPNYQARNAGRRPYVGPLKQQKWEYECAICHQWFQQRQTQLDHVNPCGQLRSTSDLPGFVERLFCEKDGLRVLCKPCHKEVTDAARYVHGGEASASGVGDGATGAPKAKARKPRSPKQVRVGDVPPEALHGA